MEYEELTKLEEEMEDATEEERWNTVLKYFPNFKLSTTKIGVSDRGANKYRVTLKNNNEKFTTTFTDSIYNTCKGIKSSNISILYCIIMDAHCYEDSRSLEDFCSEFGYDLYEERSKANKCYTGCERAYNNIIKLFNYEGYEILNAITSQM